MLGIHRLKNGTQVLPRVALLLADRCGVSNGATYATAHGGLADKDRVFTNLYGR